MIALRFLVRRVLWGMAVLWAVFTISFFLMRAAPGGPFSGEKKVSPAVEQKLKAHYLLDRRLEEQYFIILWRTAQLKFGPCMRLEDKTVNEVLAEGFPVSASLGVLALLFAFVLGSTAGVVSAVRRNSLLDVTMMTLATVGIAVPNFVLASLSIMLFVFYWHLFPAGGWGSLRQLILPAICIGLPYAAYLARLTRTGMLEVLGHDYIRTAHAKGLSEWNVIVRHALRGGLLPVVSFLGPATAGVLTGSLVAERIFNLPGMGSHFVEAALVRDYPLAMGALLAYTLLLYVMNTLVDISYAMLDPRVKVE